MRDIVDELKTVTGSPIAEKAINELETLRQRVKTQEDAANHWFKEANNEHNRAEKLEAELAELRKAQGKP